MSELESCRSGGMSDACEQPTRASDSPYYPADLGFGSGYLGRESLYSPFTGVTFVRSGLPKEHEVAERIHEVFHHFDCLAPIQQFCRQIAACLYDYIEFLAGRFTHGRLPLGEGGVEFPVTDDTPVLGPTGAFLRRVFDATRLVHEATAIHHSLTIVRFLKMLGLEQLAEADVDEIRGKSIAGTQIEGFPEIYERFDAVYRKGEALGAAMFLYATAGPAPELPATRPPILSAPEGILNERRAWAGALLHSMGAGNSFSNWDSPTKRFLRVIDVAERMPAAKTQRTKVETYDWLRRNLQDFEHTVTSLIRPPRITSHPFFRQFARHRPRRSDVWSNCLWKAMSRSPRVPEFIDDSSAESFEAGMRAFYRAIRDRRHEGSLEWNEETGKFRLKLRWGAPWGTTLDLLELDFIRFQLWEGNGLQGFYDIISHPKERGWLRWRSRRHLRLAEGVRRAFRITADS